MDKLTYRAKFPHPLQRFPRGPRLVDEVVGPVEANDEAEAMRLLKCPVAALQVFRNGAWVWLK